MTTTARLARTHVTDSSAYPQRMLTLKQYTDRQHRRLADKYDISLAEAAREAPASIYAREWFIGHVLAEFNRGLDMTSYVWRSLNEDQQRRVLRSTRALRSDRITHELRQMVGR